MRAQHHLFWLEKDQQVLYSGAPRDLRLLNLYIKISLQKLCLQNVELRASVILHLMREISCFRKTDPALVRTLASILITMRDGKPVDDKQKRFFLFHALGHGAPLLVKFVQEYWGHFARFATPQYRQLFPLLGDCGSSRQSLIFHHARPSLYLWLPPEGCLGRKLLVCFTTSSNTLNAPLPLAHVKLTDLGIPLLYVYTPREQHPGLGAATNWDIARTAGLILELAAKCGYDELYGLGTSLGGYTVCRYSEYLGLKRVLNFSGAAGRLEECVGIECIRPDQWAPRFDHSLILSVLSQGDVTDRQIAESYDLYGFKTPRLMLPSDRHGSFTAAWVGGQLDGLLDWLIQDQYAAPK